MEINRKACKKYANDNIDHYSNEVIRHFAWKYLHFVPIEKEFGGFANFSGYICNKVYKTELEKLQNKLDIAEKFIDAVRCEEAYENFKTRFEDDNAKC